MNKLTEPTTEAVLEAFGAEAAKLIDRFGSLYALHPQEYQVYCCQRGHVMADRIINNGDLPIHTKCLLCGANANVQGRVNIPNSKQFKFRAWFRPQPAEMETLRQKDPTYYSHILNGGLALTLTPMGVRAKKIPWQQRNQPCACGSGKKFKHCCGREFDA